MENRLLVSLFVCLCCLAPVVVVGGDSLNLARNPGFEEWGARPASGNDWGAAGYSVSTPGRDGGKPGRSYRAGEGELDPERHAGKYCQYFQTTTWGTGAVAAGIPVVLGHQYRISVWAKTMSGKFQFGVCLSHKPWTYLGGWVFGEPDGKWMRYSKDVTIPKGCSSVAAVMFIQGGGGYLDDFEVLDLGVPKEAAKVEDDKTPLLKGKLADKIGRQRVAIFDEPGFPTESPRPVAWYERTLKDAGLDVSLLPCAALCDSGKFNRGVFDTLLFPTGGFLPEEAETQIEAFLAKGGTVVVDANMMDRISPIPPETARQQEAMRKKYLQGEQIYEYVDFLSKNATTTYGKVFTYDRRWLPALSHFQNYDMPNQAGYLGGFHLIPWPNYCSQSPCYSRPYDAALVKNPDLRELLKDFPETVQAQGRALRMGKTGHDLTGGQGAVELANDLLLCLYQFPAVSGRGYPAFPQAGNELKDKDSDFYVLRYHNYDKEGGTLVHFGTAGATLLGGPCGAKILLETLKVAESELPGEVPADFVATANRVRKAYSDYADLSLRRRGMLTDLALAALCRGEDGRFAELKGSLEEERRLFEALDKRNSDLEGQLAKRDGGFAYGGQARARLARELKQETKRLAQSVASQPVAGKPGRDVRIEFPYLDHIYFGMDAVAGRGARGMAGLKAAVERKGLRYEGYHATCYRFDYAERGSDFKTAFPSGVLDPRSGVVKPTEGRWLESQVAEEHWLEAYRWQLERAAKDPAITGIFGLGERDFGWSQWGERDRQLFLQHLKEKYGKIGALNLVYHGAFKSFDEITLPTRKPETQPEHALWEDWTRFREIFCRDRELKLFTAALARYAPGKLFFGHSTYCGHDGNPANGINFYEYGKALKVNGFEHSNTEDKEFLTFDIAGAASRNLTSEWGVTYFPPGSQQEKVDLITERIWNGLANGQIGWSLFNFSDAGNNASNYFDLMNLPLPMGSTLASLNGQVKGFAHVILDGKREEPAVRIVYSPTTRRHTSWPDVEGDISYRAASGLYQVLKQAHVNARAIDEQEVYEKPLPTALKLLIVPNVVYENDQTHNAILRYLEGGGNVLITPESGKFDQHGERKDAWLCLAGVVPEPVEDKVLSLGGGRQYFSAANQETTLGLRPLFPALVKVLRQYRGGAAALTETGVGKGKLFVCGVNLGQDCNSQWLGKPEIPMALLEPVLAACGVKRETILPDPLVMVRPWEYKGTRYLILADRGRELVKKLDLSLLGAWKAKDFMLGLPVPATFDGEYTRFAAAMASPGGLVLELEPDARPTVAARKPTVTAPPPPESPAAAEALDFDHPFAGRLWARDTATRIGDFGFNLDVETDGGWGGRTYLTVTHGKEKQRRLCGDGKTLKCHFTDLVLTVDCEKVNSAYPVNLLCRMGVAKPDETLMDCSLMEGKFNGQDSLTLGNGLLMACVLPGLGGRLAELDSLPNGVNQLYCDQKLVGAGAGSSWSDFGGIEENAGGFPGPYWDAAFKPTILESTPERVALRLEMPRAVAWQLGYARPTSGNNRLVKELVMRKGVSALQVRLQAFNAAAGTMPTGLRIHPEWQVGGDAGPEDQFVWVEKGQAVATKFPVGGQFPAEGRFPAEGSWTALVDTAKRMAVIMGFDPAATQTVYTYSCATYCDLELFAAIKPVAPGKALEFVYSLNYIHGLSGVLAFEGGLAGNIEPRQKDGGIDFDVELGCVEGFAGTLGLRVGRDGKTVADFAAQPVSLFPGKAADRSWHWNGGTAAGGQYLVTATAMAADGKRRLVFAKAFELPGRMPRERQEALARYERALQSLQDGFANKEGAWDFEVNRREAMARVTRAAFLLGELKALANGGGDTAAVEKRLRAVLKGR